jgi:glycosyltransferase involved in cell wall biosynthesis
MPQARVLHVIAASGIGGAERMLARLIGAPRSAPPDQIVVNLLRDETLKCSVRAAGVAYEELGLVSARQAPTGLFSLVRLIRRLSPDVVQSWLYYADLMALAALELSGRRSATRLYWGIRGAKFDFDQYSALLRRSVSLCARLSSRPDGIVANSQTGLDDHLALGYAPRRAAVIPNGFDVSRFAPDAAARERVRAELGMDPIKDHTSALAVAAALPDVRFVFVGTDTQTLRGGENVLALGPRDDVISIYAASDLMLSTSLSEGFSNVIGEAMSCGVPVVATGVGDAKQIVGDTGCIVAPRDVAGMVAAIRGLLGESAEERARRSERARTRIIENYSLDRAVAAFDALHLRGVWPVDGR